MQNSTSIITSSISYDNRKIKATLQFCPEATAKVFEALTPYANDEFCTPEFEALPRDDSELNTPDDSPPPSSPASSPSHTMQDRCSSDPLVSYGNQDQIVPSEQENEEQLVELLLYVKRTDIVNCDSAMESKFFDALRPKESTPKKIVKYEYVSHTCEEHRKKHLRCPFNCKGRIVSRVPKIVSEDQLENVVSNEDMDLEGQASPASTPRGKISRSSSFSSGVEKETMDTDEDYSIESPKSKSTKKEAKKRQPKLSIPKALQCDFVDEVSNRTHNKQQQEKERIKKDREERVRARRIAAIRESLKAMEHAYDEESDVERVMTEQVQWLQDDKLFQEQNEKIINGKKKPLGAKSDVVNDASSILSGLSVAVNSNTVTSTSSSEDSSKGRRWVRFACERHRKEHAKCPENCPNRTKQEMSICTSDAYKRDPQTLVSGISST